MVLTWVTMCPTKTTIVEYGIGNLESAAKGYETKFVDGGKEKRALYIHRVFLGGLKVGQTYNYRCGNDGVWSEVHSFTTVKNRQDWSPRMAIYGDLATKSGGGRCFESLAERVKNKKYDIVFHVGDLAYNMDSYNARVGDQFMREIEPIAANVPYMNIYKFFYLNSNFSNYNNRFTMINEADGNINNHFYSFNIGPAHIISFSTEFYYFTKYGRSQILTQYQWLERDLIEANKPNNRAKRPWIITMGHKPMICSNKNNDDCTRKESRVRKGMPPLHLYGLEDLFYKYGVDIEFWGHEHSYERFWPMYNLKVYNGSIEEPYKNPKAPVHIITGYAGHSLVDPFFKTGPEWSAVRVNDFGFTEMTILNETHINIVQYSVTENKTFDELMIIKDSHGPYI
ncbi:iron/zinc purple acid phosphatase-like protein, partial [Dinothrombium tinctorium]